MKYQFKGKLPIKLWGTRCHTELAASVKLCGETFFFERSTLIADKAHRALVPFLFWCVV